MSEEQLKVDLAFYREEARRYQRQFMQLKMNYELLEDKYEELLTRKK